MTPGTFLMVKSWTALCSLDYHGLYNLRDDIVLSFFLFFYLCGRYYSSISRARWNLKTLGE